MTLNSETIKEIVKEFSGDEKKTGSSESQIAIFTKRIEYMTEHLRKNKKDHSARRGLIQLVSKPFAPPTGSCGHLIVFKCPDQSVERDIF